ncbi:MAG: hypothetical protein LBH11_03950 [Propionibacteriaceae bacterium]|jgi:hypothetical protein|nr:hypothetical protein [Propionibacteriaceae bacterium]
MGKVWTLASLVQPLVDEKVEGLRAELASGRIERGELVEMLRLVEERYHYYHNHYWGVVVKAVLAVLALIAVPYIIRVDAGTVLSPVAVVFPALSLGVSVFCVLALKSEEARLNQLEFKAETVAVALSGYYADFDPQRFTKVAIFKRMNKYRAANLVLFLFVILCLVAAAEAVMIVTGSFLF